MVLYGKLNAGKGACTEKALSSVGFIVIPTNDPAHLDSAMLTMNYRPGYLRIMRDRLPTKMICNDGMLFEFFRKIKNPMRTLLISLLLISSTVFAQKKANADEFDNLQPSFSCQHFELQDHDNTFILKENVKITLSKLYVEADSAVYLDAEKALVAYHVKNLKFSGEAEIRDDTRQNTLRYSLDRDGVIYLE